MVDRPGSACADSTLPALTQRLHLPGSLGSWGTSGPPGMAPPLLTQPGAELQGARHQELQGPRRRGRGGAGLRAFSVLGSCPEAAVPSKISYEVIVRHTRQKQAEVHGPSVPWRPRSLPPPGSLVLAASLSLSPPGSVVQHRGDPAVLWWGAGGAGFAQKSQRRIKSETDPGSGVRGGFPSARPGFLLFVSRPPCAG